MFRKMLYLALVLVFSSVTLNAHCDGEDGPVIKAANKALETGNVNYVIIWVKEKSENGIKQAFKKARTGTENKDDFYETLVRLHREAEGEEFTGVKPAGRYAGTAIPLADKSIEINSMEPLKEKLTVKQIKTLKKYFDKVISRKNYNTNDVAAGRKYVASYVEFFHHLEHLIHSHHEG